RRIFGSSRDAAISLSFQGRDRRRPVRRIPARDRDDARRAGSAPSQRRGLLALSPPHVRGDLEISLHLSRHQQSRRPLSRDRGAAGLVKAGQMWAQPAEITTLAQNIVLVASYWMSFAFARDPKAPQEDKTLARGAFHVVALAAPYLEPRERELFNQLAKQYVA